MAVAFKTALGSSSPNIASSSSWTITTTNPIAVGDLVVVRAAADNLSATTPTFTCADSGGNTYTTHRQAAANATAAAGVAGAIMCSKATAAVAAGGTITITLSGAVVAKAAYAESFTGVDNTTRSTPVSATAASGTALASGASGTVNAGDLVLGCGAIESRGAVTGDADTTNGSWSARELILASASGTDNARVEVSGQYKIPNASGAQTYNETVTSTDWVAIIVVLQAAPAATFTQASYRIYDQGTESGSTALAAQDTPANGVITTGDGIGHLRVRMQSTNAGDQSTTDDWQLQYEKNSSGTWVNVPGTAVTGYNDTNLTEGQATTNRLGAGTGSFVAGKVSEDGVAEDVNVTANNYTELLFSLTIVKPQFINGDTIRFRVLRNAATTGITYTQTPQVNVVRAPVSEPATINTNWSPTTTVVPPSTVAVFGATTTLNKPAGLANGNAVCISATGDASLAFAGFTKIDAPPTGVSMNTHSYLFYKNNVTAASEPSTYSPSAGSIFGKVTFGVSGQDPTTFLDVAAVTTNDGGQNTNIIAGPITPVTAGCYLLMSSALWVAVTITANPAGMTLLGYDTSTGDNHAVWGQLLTAAGSTGTRTATTNNNTEDASVMAAIRPAPAVAGPSLVATSVGTNIVTSSSGTPTMPVGYTVTADDYLVVEYVGRGGHPATPSGYTAVQSTFTGVGVGFFYKKLAGGDTAPTISTAGMNGIVCWVKIWRGANLAAFLDATFTQATATATAPSITTVTDNAVVANIGGTFATSDVWTHSAANGFTADTNSSLNASFNSNNGGQQISSGSSHKAVATAGATTGPSFGINTGNDASLLTYAIRPAPVVVDFWTATAVGTVTAGGGPVDRPGTINTNWGTWTGTAAGLVWLAGVPIIEGAPRRTVTGAVGNAVTLNAPAGVQPGEYVVAVAVTADTNASGSISVAGMVARDIDHISLGGGVWLHHGVFDTDGVDASGTATYVMSVTSTPIIDMGAVMWRVSGTSGFDVAATGISAVQSGTSPMPMPSITTSVAKARAMILFSFDLVTGPHTTPATWVEVYDSGAGEKIWTKPMPTAGATGTDTSTPSGSTGLRTAYTFAYLPPVGAVDVPGVINSNWGTWSAVAVGSINRPATIASNWGTWSAVANGGGQVSGTIATNWGTWTGTAIGTVTTPGVNVSATINTLWATPVAGTGTAAFSESFSQPDGTLALGWTTPGSANALRVVNGMLDKEGASGVADGYKLHGVPMTGDVEINFDFVLDAGTGSIGVRPCLLNIANGNGNGILVTGDGAGNGVVHIQRWTGGTTGGSYFTNYPHNISDTNVHHCRVTYAAATGLWDIFIDGVGIGSGNDGSAMPNGAYIYYQFNGQSNCKFDNLTINNAIGGGGATVYQGWDATAIGNVASGVIDRPGNINTNWGTWTATAVALANHKADIATSWGTWTATGIATPTRAATISTTWAGWTATAIGLGNHKADVASNWGTWTATGVPVVNHPATTAINWGTWTATAIATSVHTATINTNWGTWDASALGMVPGAASGTIDTNWGTWTATGVALANHVATIASNWGTWTGTAIGTPSRTATIASNWGTWTATAAATVNHKANISTSWATWTATAIGEAVGQSAGVIDTNWGTWTAAGDASIKRDATIVTNWGTWTAVAVGVARLPVDFTATINTNWGTWTATAFGTAGRAVVLNDAAALYLGDLEASAAYVGAVQVWPHG